MKLGEECKDGGKCHHGCDRTCFRQLTCVPLSASGLNDDWSEPLHPHNDGLDEYRQPVHVGELDPAQRLALARVELK